MITDEMEKNDLYSLTAQWILHSDTEDSFDYVLMFSPNYYSIDLTAVKTYICDLIFLQHFFHSIRHVYKYPQNRRMLLTEANLLGTESRKSLFFKDFVVGCFPLVCNTEINAGKGTYEQVILLFQCFHSAKDWIVIVFFLTKNKRFLVSLCCDQILIHCSCLFELALGNISCWCHGRAKIYLFQKESTSEVSSPDSTLKFTTTTLLYFWC